MKIVESAWAFFGRRRTESEDTRALRLMETMFSEVSQNCSNTTSEIVTLFGDNIRTDRPHLYTLIVAHLMHISFQDLYKPFYAHAPTFQKSPKLPKEIAPIHYSFLDAIFESSISDQKEEVARIRFPSHTLEHDDLEEFDATVRGELENLYAVFKEGKNPAEFRTYARIIKNEAKFKSTDELRFKVRTTSAQLINLFDILNAR